MVTHFYTNILQIVIAVLCIIFLFYRKGDSIFSPSISTFLGTSLLLCLIGATIYYFNYQPPKGYQMVQSYALNFISLLVLIIGLAVIYSAFLNEIRRIDGWPGLIFSIIFLIPCLVIDFIKYLMQEVSTTPTVVFVLFIIELLLVLAYFYMGMIIKKLYVPTGNILQNTPVSLNVQTNLSSIQAFELEPPMSSIENKTFYSSNYGLSMWIYVNNTMTGNKKYTLFNYGVSGSSSGKPCIAYSGNDQWTFTFSDNGSVEYTTYIPSQKWNNIVLNYNNQRVDLFINGNLEKTVSLTPNLPTYNPSDVVFVGSEKGISGAICNVVYYNTPLTKTQISQSWNMLFSQNPPINNLY
jgi:hypothetical protein